jgi:1,2-phenylacetyl-CoA epoxidase catalytic subunit
MFLYPPELQHPFKFLFVLTWKVGDLHAPKHSETTLTIRQHKMKQRPNCNVKIGYVDEVKESMK